VSFSEDHNLPVVSEFELLMLLYIVVQVFNLEMAAFSRREKEISRGTASSAATAAPLTSTITPPSRAASPPAATSSTSTTTTTAAAAAVDSVTTSSTVTETVSPVQPAVAG